ncbi:hypothetical protein BM526_18900 (plasmid) [Alteromonas mediterranea]|uniref:hypothetical protein n=1 Tax=Alteromonas mediterranea TaxID=314275 RepID=UPI0009041815|nr:hypothetical protein [Alteromonas mediterranea]APE04039.1 hypothetical protein BM526_18900 [Alteromonas mediterranea]
MMITKNEFIRLIDFLKYHNKCNTYYDNNTGLIHLGYQTKVPSLQIVDEKVVYHVDHGDIVMLDNSHGLERISVRHPTRVNVFSIHRYQSPRKSLPFPVDEYTPFDESLQGIDYRFNLECNWSLFEMVQQLATTSLLKILDDEIRCEQQKEKIKIALSSSDILHPCIKTSNLLEHTFPTLKSKIISEISQNLNYNRYIDSNGNIIGASTDCNEHFIGPIAVLVETDNEQTSIAESCQILGRDISLLNLSHWFTYLSKSIPSSLIASEFGLGIVYGALKQAGLHGEHCYVTNNPNAISVLKSEFK